MPSHDQALRAALHNRQDLLTALHQQGTDCYRLFHGSQEGAGGLTVDRYGPQLLVQSFHQSLSRDELLQLAEQCQASLGTQLLLVYNDRSQGNSRVDRTDAVYQAEPAALEDLIGHEWGLNYSVRGRHAGQDPLLFLDLRNARGWVKAHSAGKSVLNLFAYTCGVGLSAAAGGASEVVNLDFAEGNLAVGRENGALNPELAPMQFVQSDYFPAIRQLAGLPINARRGQKLPHYPRLEQRQFDLVLLDPPAWAKSAFGTVDLLQQPGKSRHGRLARTGAALRGKTRPPGARLPGAGAGKRLPLTRWPATAENPNPAVLIHAQVRRKSPRRASAELHTRAILQGTSRRDR